LPIAVIAAVWSDRQAAASGRRSRANRPSSSAARCPASEADPPLPDFWGGFVVSVDELECWQGRPDRLHDRVRYHRDGDGGWRRERLAP